ncbi:hypothetical protein PCASD_25558 [Puccinia coronata f. sp. avenae]|uniref:Uncharacterized protein n=1 Tax=Puccinia coronata f. sp. avenae TaxID=200324 RepID=A0A2N5RZT0_9BASI|nr:hypothetical protein PCASD_25558 [Puccinia coronata f. sp. avenae]
MSTDGGLEQTTMASQCAAEVEGTWRSQRATGTIDSDGRRLLSHNNRQEEEDIRAMKLKSKKRSHLSPSQKPA